MDHQLFTLLHEYYALTPANRLQFPSECSPKLVNDFLVTEILINEHHQQYPPSVQYQTRFWKWAIENLEELARRRSSEEDDEEFEIDSRIYDKYMSLMLPVGPSPDPSVRDPFFPNSIPHGEAAPSQSYITHFWNMFAPSPASLPSSMSQALVDRHSYYTASLLESRTVIEGGTTGLRTWLASFVLAQYLIVHPELVASKCILELGSGIGFLGIIISSLQQLQKTSSEAKGSCWLTDINDEVLLRCHDNINLPCNISSSHADMHYLKLDWFESLEEDSHLLTNLIREKINPDLILGADLAFVPSLIPALVGTLKISLQSSSSLKAPKIAIIALTLRNGETLNLFHDHLSRASLHVQELPIGFDKTSFSETIESHSSCGNVKLFRITCTSSSCYGW